MKVIIHLFLFTSIVLNTYAQKISEGFKFSGKTKYYTESRLDLLYKSKDTLIIYNSFGPQAKVEKIDFYKRDGFELLSSFDLLKSPIFAPLKKHQIERVIADKGKIYILSSLIVKDNIGFHYSILDYKNSQPNLTTKEIFFESVKSKWIIDYDTSSKVFFITGDINVKGSKERTMYFSGISLNGNLVFSELLKLPLASGKSENEFRRVSVQDKQGIFYFMIDEYGSGFDKQFGAVNNSVLYQFNPKTKKLAEIKFPKEFPSRVVNVKLTLDKSDNPVLIGNFNDGEKDNFLKGFILTSFDKTTTKLLDFKKYDFNKLNIVPCSNYTIANGLDQKFRITESILLPNNEKLLVFENAQSSLVDNIGTYMALMNYILLVKLDKVNTVSWTKWIPRAFTEYENYSVVPYSKVVSGKTIFYIKDAASLTNTVDVVAYEDKENKKSGHYFVQVTVNNATGEVTKKVLSDFNIDKKYIFTYTRDNSKSDKTLYFHYVDKGKGGDLYRRIGFLDIR